MAPSIKKEMLQSVAPLGPSIEDDFYMATFREGKVQKVINVMGGPPRRVRRVLDFDSKVEIEKEEALARKRRELDSASEFEVQTGEEEKTLAEVMQEIRKRKSGGALATVQRKKLIPAKKAKSGKKAMPSKNQVPMEEVFPVEEVVSIEGLVSTEEVISLEEEVHTEKVISMQETIPVEEVVPVEKVVPVEEMPPLEEVVPVETSPPRKKRKKRTTSLIHTSSKLLDVQSEAQGDDQTLAELLKKSVSTTGRASSDNAGIKVFQRRKVKFKAVRRPTSKIGDKQSSSILVCDDLCECEACGPLSVDAIKTVEGPMTGSRVSSAASMLTSCSTSTISNVPEEGNLEGSTNEIERVSHPDSCTGEFDSLTLPDDLHQLPVVHCNPHIDDIDDIQGVTDEHFRVEVGQQIPSNTEVSAEGSDFSCSATLVSDCPGNSHVGRYDEYLDACHDASGPSDSDMPEVLDAESGPKLLEETPCVERDVGRGRCAFNTESSIFSFSSPLDLNGSTYPVVKNAASAVTPMELDLAVEQIESILDTLVTPDDLLPTHLSASIGSASKSTKKKKKRRRFSESVSLDMVSTEGICLGEVSPMDNLRTLQRQEEALAEPTSLDALMPVTKNVSSTVSDTTEEGDVSTTIESSDLRGQHISEQVSIHISDQISEQISEQIAGQISELLTQELGSAPEPTLSLTSELKDMPAICSMDLELVLPNSQGDIVVNAEECCLNDNSLVPLSSSYEVVRTPTKSTGCDEGSGTSQTTLSSLDAPESDESVGGTSTSKALFSNLKADSFNKRNRKSFSPKSQKAFLAALKPERSSPPMKLKVMKSKLSESCSSMLFSQVMVNDKTPLEEQSPTPDDSSAQDVLRCDQEQIQLVASLDSRPLSPPPQTIDETLDTSAPSSSEPQSDCNIYTDLGSPEYKKEPYVSRQDTSDPVSIYTTDHCGSNIPCTEGFLHINVECHPDTPSDPKTPSMTEPATHLPKSILKSSRSDTCRGVCECPRCVSTCDQSRTARKFIRSQMMLADLVASKLLDEMRNLRTLVEEASPSSAEGDAAISASNIPSDKAKGALESATKMEDWAKKEILKMSRDSKRVCRLIDVGPRRTIFADDAGHRLCHVKLLPAKKTLSKESLLPTKNF